MPITVTGAATRPGGSASVVPTVHEMSVQGRAGGLDLPAPDVPRPRCRRPRARDNGLPELSQLDVVRHYLRSPSAISGWTPASIRSARAP